MKKSSYKQSKNKQLKKPEKKPTTVKYEYDSDEENSLFGTPNSPQIRYYICVDHGKLLPSKIKWNGNILICPKCGKYCNLFEDNSD